METITLTPADFYAGLIHEWNHQRRPDTVYARAYRLLSMSRTHPRAMRRWRLDTRLRGGDIGEYLANAVSMMNWAKTEILKGQ